MKYENTRSSAMTSFPKKHLKESLTSSMCPWKMPGCASGWPRNLYQLSLLTFHPSIGGGDSLSSVLHAPPRLQSELIKRTGNNIQSLYTHSHTYSQSVQQSGISGMNVFRTMINHLQSFSRRLLHEIWRLKILLSDWLKRD